VQCPRGHAASKRHRVCSAPAANGKQETPRVQCPRGLNGQRRILSLIQADLQSRYRPYDT